VSGLSTFARSVRADHAAMVVGRAKYRTDGSSSRTDGLVGDAVQKIGFQMMVAIRVMRLVRDSRVPFGARLISRAIRHLYGAEVHWDAEIADGVSIVHGTGLVLSHGAVVGPGCILFQGVTLGESIDPSSRVVGAPTLKADVHVGPGAVLIGPIVVGEGTKVMANVVLDQSVSARSIVRGPSAVIELRSTP
jgi:serine O-acetyltransferase